MGLKLQALSLSILLGIQVALGVVLIKDLDDLSDKTDDYDFIIVGGK